jgi:hypothetical protein
MSSQIKISVVIPEERVVDFYDNFTAWLRRGPLAVEPDLEPDEVLIWGVGNYTDRAAAEAVWSKLSGRARALFELLARNPGRKHSARELAESLEIPNGMYGVAGVLAWPARHAAVEGYGLPISYEDGAPGEGANYWMKQAVAEVFAAVIEQGEAPGSESSAR